MARGEDLSYRFRVAFGSRAVEELPAAAMFSDGPQVVGVDARD